MEHHSQTCGWFIQDHHWRVAQETVGGETTTQRASIQLRLTSMALGVGRGDAEEKSTTHAMARESRRLLPPLYAFVTLSADSTEIVVVRCSDHNVAIPRRYGETPTCMVLQADQLDHTSDD